MDEYDSLANGLVIGAASGAILGGVIDSLIPGRRTRTAPGEPF